MGACQVVCGVEMSLARPIPNSVSEWQSPETLAPDDGVEILIRFKRDGIDSVWIGASVHQIASWNYEGELFCKGRKLRFEDLEGWAPLPKS